MSQVRIRDQFGNYSRVVFDGNEDDARKYIVDNFPRLHVEPGSTATAEPDAQLDTGAHWDGVKWHNEPAAHDDEDIASADHRDDTAPLDESHAEDSVDGVAVTDIPPVKASAPRAPRKTTGPKVVK